MYFQADQAEVSQAESGAEIPVNVFDEGAGEEQPSAEAPEEPVAEEAVEEEPAAEEPAAEQEAEQPEEVGFGSNLKILWEKWNFCSKSGTFGVLERFWKIGKAEILGKYKILKI